MTLLPPHRAHPRCDRAAATGATCPAWRTARGTGGNPPRAACGLASKGRQAGESRTRSHQPHWGFLLFVTSACAGREGEGDDAAPRRAGGRRTRTSWGRGPGREEPELRRTTAGVNTYPACRHLFTEPATTTPPPHHEHRLAILFSSPPWSLSCDGSATSRRVAR
jgi:hypothetical protein